MARAAAKRTTDVQDDIDALKTDLAQARADFADLVRDVVSAGKAEGSEAKAKIEAAIHDRIERIGEGLGSVQRMGKRRVEDLQDTIEERPLTSVAVALGVGMLMGVVFARR
jgi:ElaB/YqjD/DUF883 family membrane-anchored ribosome-binding protein